MSAPSHLVLRRNWRRVNRAGDYALLPGEMRVGIFHDEAVRDAIATRSIDLVNTIPAR